MNVPSDIIIRPATRADLPALSRLAELDSQHLAGERYLLAEVDDKLVAAIDGSGAAIADPFRPTADVIELLRMRARPENTRRSRLLLRTA
jgi:hypothetical protein